jgi:hypothetical protein
MQEITFSNSAWMKIPTSARVAAGFDYLCDISTVDYQYSGKGSNKANFIPIGFTNLRILNDL